MNPNMINAILIIVLVTMLGLGLIYFILLWSKSHRLRTRHSLNNTNYIKDYWIVEKKDKIDGSIKWKSCLGKIKIDRPPEEAIDVGSRGRMFAECYMISDDELVWICDKGIKMVAETNDNGIKTGKYKIQDVTTNGKVKTIDTFKPFSPTQRTVVANQFMKAETISKQNKWSKQDIIQLTVVGSLVFVIALGLIFGSDLLKAYSEAQSASTGACQNLAKITAHLTSAEKPPQEIGASTNSPTIRTTGEDPPE